VSISKAFIAYIELHSQDSALEDSMPCSASPYVRGIGFACKQG